MKLVWRKYVWHGGAHMVEVEKIYIPHEWILEFLEGEHGHRELVVEWNIYKWMPHKQMSRCQGSKIILAIFGIFLFTFIFMLLLFHFCHTLHNSRFGNWPHLCKYACEYELGDNHENNTQSIKWRCLVQFSIRWLYTRHEVVEMIFYHKPHTHFSGEPTHGKHDPNSITRSFFFTPQMSQTLKDCIWGQLVFGYTMK